jgi:hypothetical protein
MSATDMGPLFASRFHKPSSRERFEAFHRENPTVYQHLVRLAREAKSAGQRVGMRCLWERLRWFSQIEVKDETQRAWKLNDHYAPWFARLITATEPDLRDFFETRDRASNSENEAHP